MDSVSAPTEPVPADPPPAPPQPGAAAHRPPGLTATLRRALHTSALFVCVFLFIRTLAVEPFGVPTGSMTPALIGNHREGDCPRCGYPIVVGAPGKGQPDPFAHACCQNCGKRKIDLSAARDIPGDRLLVDKNVFGVRSPRRWEVAVFRCPVDLTVPYVKRVGGLPGEAVQVIGGDLFANGVLQRKTLPQLREIAVPFFDLGFAPPDGWAARWLVEAVAENPRLPNDRLVPKPRPADETVLRGNALHLDATVRDRQTLGLAYRHWDLDENAERPVTDWLAYNGWHPDDRRRAAPQPVHDFVLNCDLEIVAGSGRFSCTLNDGADTVKAAFQVGDSDKPTGAQLTRDGGDTPSAAPGLRLEVGKTYRLEFAFADRRASLALDGKEVVPAIDLPGNAVFVARRREVTRPVQFEVRGVSVVLRNVRLLRDAHYWARGRSGCDAPYQLKSDEYFMLGDNSTHSADSRVWENEETGAHIPGVPERDFIGKPFLIHQPLKAGRVTVNGRDRTYQTVDWSRLRWLR